MTYRHFYDKDASPIPGKAPIQMRVKGGPASSTVQAGIDSVLNAFLANARISEASNLQKTVTLPDGTTVRMRSRFGLVIVDVEIPPRKKESEEEEVFYGGIIIRPTVVPEEISYFPLTLPPIVGDVQAVRVVPTDTKVKGLAVPGSKVKPTEHLVLQIAGDQPLGDTPVAKGLVKIFRISDPLVGTVTEVNTTPGKYLLSTQDFSEFYICGQRVNSLPPLPTPDITTNSAYRLRTFRFGFQSFEKAGATAHGIVILAVNHQLFAINTGNHAPGAPAAWALLHTASPPAGQNAFGITFEETRSEDGSTVITCSGSNGAGVCSGFAVTVTPQTSGPPLISGTITPMGDGRIPAVAGSAVFSKTVTNTRIDFTPFSYTYTEVELTIVDEGAPDHWINATPNPISRTITVNGAGYDTSTVATYVLTDAQPERLPDTFLGGFLPFVEPRVETWTWDIAADLTHDSSRVSHDGLVGAQVHFYGKRWGTFKGVTGQYLHGDGGNLFIEDHYEAVSYHDSADGVFVAAEGVPGDHSITAPPEFDYFVQQTCAADGEHTTSAEFMGDGEWGSTATLSADYTPPENYVSGSSSLTSSSVLVRTEMPTVTGFAPTEARVYTARDEHCEKIVLLREAAQTVTCSTPAALDEINTDELFNLNTIDLGFPAPTGGGHLTLDGADFSVSYGAATVTLKLIRPDASAVHDFGSLLDGSGMNALTPRTAAVPAYARLPVEDMLGPPYVSSPPATEHQIYEGVFPAMTREVTYTATRTFPAGPHITHVAVGDFATMFPGSEYAVNPPADPPDFITAQSLPKDGPTYLQRAFTHPLLINDLQTERDVIFRDLRTGGFVVQVLWQYRHGFAPSVETGRFLETRIGNDFGTIPLVDVLNEWIISLSPERREVGYVGPLPLDKVLIDPDDDLLKVSLI